MFLTARRFAFRTMTTPKTKVLENKLNHMSLKRISSPVSLPFKATILLMALAVFAGSLVQALLSELTWWLLLCPLFGVILFAMLRPLLYLRKVEMDSEGLVVSSMLKRVRIPFSSVTSEAFVDQHRGFMVVTIVLDDPSIYGGRIEFIPAMGISIRNNSDLLLLQDLASIKFERRSMWTRFKKWVRIR